MRPRSIGGLAAVAVLGACATVLPKPPEQLYRFGWRAPPAVSAAASRPERVISLALRRVTLPRAAAGDAILTSTGDRVAYVARVRWASPAVVLLQEAVARAFAAEPGVRLLARGDDGGAVAELELDGLDFETRYGVAGAPPEVRIVIHAALVRPDGGPLADRSFAIDEPASENRVSAIVAAYDRAVTTVLGETVAWSLRQAPAASPPHGVSPAS